MLATPESDLPKLGSGVAVEGAMASQSFHVLLTLTRTSLTHSRCAFRHSVHGTTTVAARVGLSSNSYKGITASPSSTGS